MNTPPLLQPESPPVITPGSVSRTRNRGKAALAIFGAFLAFLIVLRLFGGSDANRIESALRADRELSRRIGAQVGAADKYWDSSEIVGRYVQGLRELDLSRCPKDFQIAYLQHIQAWETAQQVMAQNQGWNGFVKGFLSGLGGTATAGSYLSGSIDTQQSSQRVIYDTWHQVEQIAVKYGANIRK